MISIPYLAIYSQVGDQVWSPFEIAASRGPKLFSIFNFVYNHPFPFPGDYYKASIPIMAGVGFVTYIYYICNRLDVLHGVLLASLVTILFNKVGHLQFLMTTAFLLIFWMSREDQASNKTRYSAWCFLVWISFVSLSYKWTGGFRSEPWYIIRRVGSLPMSLFCGWLFWSLLAAGRSEQHPL